MKKSKTEYPESKLSLNKIQVYKIEHLKTIRGGLGDNDEKRKSFMPTCPVCT